MEMNLEQLRGFFSRSPFMVDLGVEAIACAPGRVTTCLQLQARHLQHTGQVHAGVSAAMADHSMGAAAQTLAPAGHWVVTAELKTSCLRAARGDRLVCEATVIKAGRQISFTEAEVWCESGADRVLVAKTSASMAHTVAN